MNSSKNEQVDFTIFLNETSLSVQQRFNGVYGVMFLISFGLFVNIILFLGLIHSEALSENPRYRLLKNLIASDLLLTLCIGLPSIYSLLNSEVLTFSYRCVAQYFTVALAIINSLFTVTSMALERFVYICHGIHYLSIMTNRRMYCYIAFLFFFSLSCAAMSTILMLMGGANYGRIIDGFVCEAGVLQAQLEQPEYFEAFNKIFISSLLLVCLLMFLFSYSRMYQEARRVQESRQQDNARARCTISFYFAIFLLQLLPSTIKLISLFGKGVDNQAYMIMLLLVPPCVNPLAYGVKNEEVRQALARLYVCRKLKELISR